MKWQHPSHRYPLFNKPWMIKGNFWIYICSQSANHIINESWVSTIWEQLHPDHHRHPENWTSMKRHYFKNYQKWFLTKDFHNGRQILGSVRGNSTEGCKSWRANGEFKQVHIHLINNFNSWRQLRFTKQKYELHLFLIYGKPYGGISKHSWGPCEQ